MPLAEAVADWRRYWTVPEQSDDLMLSGPQVMELVALLALTRDDDALRAEARRRGFELRPRPSGPSGACAG